MKLATCLMLSLMPMMCSSPLWADTPPYGLPETVEISDAQAQGTIITYTSGFYSGSYWSDTFNGQVSITGFANWNNEGLLEFPSIYIGTVGEPNWSWGEIWLYNGELGVLTAGDTGFTVEDIAVDGTPTLPGSIPEGGAFLSAAFFRNIVIAEGTKYWGIAALAITMFVMCTAIFKSVGNGSILSCFKDPRVRYPTPYRPSPSGPKSSYRAWEMYDGNRAYYKPKKW